MHRLFILIIIIVINMIVGIGMIMIMFIIIVNIIILYLHFQCFLARESICSFVDGAIHCRLLFIIYIGNKTHIYIYRYPISEQNICANAQPIQYVWIDIDISFWNESKICSGSTQLKKRPQIQFVVYTKIIYFIAIFYCYHHSYCHYDMVWSENFPKHKLNVTVKSSIIQFYCICTP